MLKHEKLQYKYQTIDNGTILPHKRVDTEQPRYGIGGITDTNGNFVSISAIDNGWFTWGGAYHVQQSKTISETVVYLGYIIDHWGHFLVDGSSRIWYLVSKYYHGEKIVIITNYKTLNKSILDFFQLLGIPQNNLILLSDGEMPLECTKIIIPEPAYVPRKYYSDEFKIPFQIASQNISNDSFVSSDTQKIYFSRQHLKAAKKKEYGEERLQSLLVKQNWQIFYPEELSLREQINIWKNAQYIACINGTIPLNCCFATGRSNIAVINKTKVTHLNLYEFAQIFDCKIDYINCYDEKRSKDKVLLGTGPFLMKPTSSFINYFQCSATPSDSLRDIIQFRTTTITIKTQSACKKILSMVHLMPLLSQIKHRLISKSIEK